MDPHVIQVKYLQGFFLIDLIGTVPIELIVTVILGGAGADVTRKSRKSLKLLKYFKLPKLLRIRRLVKILRELGKCTFFLNVVCLY